MMATLGAFYALAVLDMDGNPTGAFFQGRHSAITGAVPTLWRRGHDFTEAKRAIEKSGGRFMVMTAVVTTEANES